MSKENKVNPSPQLHLQGQEAKVRTAAFLMANAAAICLSVYCTQRYIRR